MRINHNIQALNAYRNLNHTMGLTSKSLEKLSSGLRINRAADDAAGLAISEKMRSQIRGLDMAERNALDAVSLIQTAEGALNETHGILQRMRELSVQAANGTLEESDRTAIQTEINQLTYEIDRIADTTQFNQKKLFSGNEQGRPFAEISAEEVSFANGKFSGTVKAEPTSPAKVTMEFDEQFGALKKATLEGKTISINGKVYEIDLADGTTKGIAQGNIAVNVSGWNDNATTEAQKAANVNKVVTALKQAIDNNDADFFNASPVNAVGTTGNFTKGRLELSTDKPMAQDDLNAMGTKANLSKSTQLTGLQFTNPYSGGAATTKLGADPDSLAAKSFTIDFSKAPEQGDSLKIGNLTINFGTSNVNYANGRATIDVTGKNVSDILNEVVGIMDHVRVNDTTKLAGLSPVYSVAGTMLSLGTDKTSSGLNIELTDGDYESYRTQNLDVNFQIGANAEETLEINLSIMDAARLGVGFNADDTATTVGNNAAKGVDVSTEEAANAAISIMDEAIRRVSDERSKLGAYQNRLEYTVTNLQTANENLTAAESRIRDLDMALEMTNFTRNNILNQAGQAMLAQANQLPQGILQLLQ